MSSIDQFIAIVIQQYYAILNIKIKHYNLIYTIIASTFIAYCVNIIYFNLRQSIQLFIIMSDQAIPASQKESHQLKALMLKNFKIQARQPCTNICQVITPIICLVFTILIRDVAISKIPNDNDSIYSNFPTIPIKFNDYTLEKLAPKFVKRSCTQWYNYQVKNQADVAVIGSKNGDEHNYGLLSKVKNTKDSICNYNFSKVQPYMDEHYLAPIFIRDNQSVNVRIMDAIQYFNNMNESVLRNTTAIDKIPDGSITFYEATMTRLQADLKINDLRLIQYHRNDGVTRIKFYNNKTESFQSYYLIPQGFLGFQHTITIAYIQYVTGATIESGLMYLPFLPNSSVFVDLLVNTVTTILFPISLSLLLPVFLYLIVLQKQEKLIQMMRMNGMKMRNYWLINFLFSFIISVITNMVFFLFGYFFMDNALFHQTSKDVLFIILLGWILAQIGMSTFFQVFLASSRAANIIGYLISIWTNLIGATLSIALYQYPRPLPVYFLLYPTFAFNRIFYLMFTECSADRCYNSLANLPSQAKHCIAVLYVSFVVFQLMGMYLYQVIPQEYGTRQPLTFPFKFITSRISNKDKQHFNTIQQIPRVKQNHDEDAKNQRARIADVVSLSDYPLVVSGLRKVYSNGKTAVKGMDLLIQDRQVFGLLGPNGAGKTTLISMITGVFECTAGDCFVAGHSIKNQIQKVHLNIGVCPQFDILWPQLTVEEHLYFYTRLRGTKSSQQSKMVEKALKQVNLTEFKNFKASQLSGGMKRRLSVGISMVGDPRIVFLDQPTTGLDPENRRNLWDVLNKCRQNRALFLTTHLMQQADALCSRIGIITQGVLRTIGTPQKLKKVYGNGYYLSLNLQIQRPKIQNQSGDNTQMQENNEQITDHQNSIVSMAEQIQARAYMNQTLVYQKINKTRMEAIKSQIQSLFPKAVLQRQISGYLRFNLGNVKISEVMMKLAKSQTPQIRQNWGLTNSNLEDVFIEVVRRFDQEDQLNQTEDQESITNLSPSKSESLMTQDHLQRHSIQH